jgi:hypothetical protein
MKKEPLKLMPIEDLKKVISVIAQLPKEAVEKVEAARPKRRKPKNS